MAKALGTQPEHTGEAWELGVRSVAQGKLEFWRAPGEVVSAAFSPDGNIHGFVAQDGVLQGERATVTALAISPDGNALYSGAEDGSIFMWSLPR